LIIYQLKLILNILTFHCFFITTQDMLSLFIKCCDDLISKWEKMLSSDGSSEMDVWPFLQNLTSDVISRTAFGSSYEEGRRIFQLLKEQSELIVQIMLKAYIPGWR